VAGAPPFTYHEPRHAAAWAKAGHYSLSKNCRTVTFVIESEIGDRAVFSGLATLPPLVTTIDDLAAYETHAAHFGTPPPS
jgi:hypothetical protein